MKQPVSFALTAILSIVLATFSLQVWGVDCSGDSLGNINLTSQDAVDNFQPTYGGGGVCDAVSGSLRIWYSADITNLNGLSSLTSITGGLVIYDNDALTNLDGLSNLTSIGGGLNITYNTALTNLDGLSSLTSVGENLYIEYNDALANLNGLSSLTSIGWTLIISGNTNLTNLNGLSSLTSVGGGLQIGCRHDSCDNDNLTNLDGLSSLISVGAYLHIEIGASLTNLDGLSSLTSVGGDLFIWDNTVLTNLDGLSSLNSVGEQLFIAGNSRLTNIDGLSSLTSVTRLNIIRNASLTNLDGLSSLTSVGGDLLIEDNTNLTNLDGLSSLNSVGGELDINRNSRLTNLDGLSSLTGLGGGLSIGGNTALANIDGLSNLTNTSLGGHLGIGGNPYLTNLEGLSNITSVGGSLIIWENAALANIGGLSSITSVGRKLEFGYNAALTNLDGLSSITSVGMSLYIGGNSRLTNLDGLSSLTSVGGYLDINSNPVLSRCSALSPLLGWPVGPPYDNVGGNITVYANKPGCNSVQEILASSGLTAPYVTASVISSGQVTLIFTPAYSSDISWPITGYQAQCLAEDQSFAASETSPVTITGLANNQIYSCSVSAVTGQGTGPASNTVSANFTTDPFTIGGHVSGLSGTGLVLRNNFDDDLEISADGSFTFATALYDGSTYSVTILTASPNQTCSITNSNGTVSGADVVDVMVTCFKTNNELRNIATRAEVRTGNEILIGGFVILGNEPKCVIVQGLGQSVNVPDGVTRLADPVLQLKSGLTTIAQNDNWQVQDNPADVQAIEDSGRAPDDILEAAIYKCLNPGAYTALMTGFNNSTGVGMVAIYDADNRTSYLKNIATRSWVGIDHAISIAGFVVTGDTPKQILVRGLGPSMESKFPPNSPLLLDPQLRLYQGATLMETNDDWGDAANAAEIGALPEPLPPTDAKEPAILMTLEPGLYTAHLLGVDGTTGIGNVAVYDLTGRQ